jgi:flagellin-like protein
MKKVWSVRKELEAVSPVIATILMVAITVVLASVLYVMVMQPWIVNDGPQGGTINGVSVKGNTSAEIIFGLFTGRAQPTQLKVILEQDNGDRITLTWPYVPDSNDFTMTSSDADVTAIYRDYAPETNEINNGDSIFVSGLDSGNTYQIKLVTISGSEVDMTGKTSFVLAS